VSNKSLLSAQKILARKDQVQAYQMLACRELREQVKRPYESIASGSLAKQIMDMERVERLVLRLSSLKKINVGIMEELFFDDIIGNVQIDSLIPSIIGSDVVDSIEGLVDESVNQMNNEGQMMTSDEGNLTRRL